MELLVYKASAGSGKTFTLAVEYIKLLVINPRAYRGILAVTFTNKATAEMKERIVSQLQGIWKGLPSSEAYFRRVQNDLKHTGMSEADIRKAAGTALQYMLHDYSRFRVETIDSFFQSVMRNLARELELSPNLNIELNNTEVLSDAVDSMIEKLTPASPVLAWLLNYIGERIANDKRWNVSDEIKRFGRNIFDEGYIEQGEGLRRQLQDAQLLPAYRKELRDMEQAALQQMKTFAERFDTLLSEHSLSAADLKGGKNSIGSYFRKLGDGRLSDKEVVNATLSNSRADARNWTAKTSPRKDEIIALAESKLLPLLEEAETYRPKNNRIVNSCRLSLQHLNELQLLAGIDEEVRLLNREHNRFLLSDTNALLHNLLGDGDSSFVFEKIGASIRNVMIDEFQDTSRMQWDNFRILLLEGLSQGADSLIVGDVKQSIYRWRNGDWRILNELRADADGSFPFPVRVETLKTNRRSETRIIDFNNRLFCTAVEWLNEIHLKELKEDCRPLLYAYADVEQASARADTKGYIKVSMLQPDDTHNYTECTLAALGEEITHLLESGIRQSDITILVRKNKSIPAIADYLASELRLPVVSDEAFRMDASRALCVLIDALRVLSVPDDKISRAGIDNQLQTSGDRLLSLPLYELLEELYAQLHLADIPSQDAYLFSFFDAVTEYLQTHSSDIGGFIRYWDETLSSKTIPGGEIDGIRILSIHKSKGLEFHTVLVPFCDWKLENETNNQLLWCTPTEAPFNTLQLVPVNYSATLAESVYREDYLNERLQLWVDNLNLLYVAFTRAEKNLIVWSREGQKGTMAELLTAALEEELNYEEGELCPSSTSDKDTRQDAVAVKMQSLHPTVEFKQSNRSADFIAGVEDESESDNRFIRRGRLLHTLFADIDTETDIDTAVDRLLFEGIIDTSAAAEEIRTLTRNAFALPQVHDWYNGSWTLLNERDIIWQEQGNLHTRRPDRVMMRGNDLVVVDFKFGQPRKKYNAQVTEYMQLLARIGYPKEHIKGYLWYVERGEVVEV
jgi:ATP-dependent exoDNAse (exonuclease V) beta subunit